MGNLVTFRGSTFVDAHNRTNTAMYKCAHFVGLILTVHESTVKTAKIGPLENFPLYSSKSIYFATFSPGRCLHTVK